MGAYKNSTYLPYLPDIYLVSVLFGATPEPSSQTPGPACPLFPPAGRASGAWIPSGLGHPSPFSSGKRLDGSASTYVLTVSTMLNCDLWCEGQRLSRQLAGKRFLLLPREGLPAGKLRSLDNDA
jgi:hypothetical protein